MDYFLLFSTSPFFQYLCCRLCSWVFLDFYFLPSYCFIAFMVVHMLIFSVYDQSIAIYLRLFTTATILVSMYGVLISSPLPSINIGSFISFLLFSRLCSSVPILHTSPKSYYRTNYRSLYKVVF